ncbi:restriction endonuclease subunit S [Bacillus sp. MN7755]
MKHTLIKYKLSDLCEITMGQSPKGIDCNTDGLGVPLLNGPTEFSHEFPIPVQFTTSPKKMANIGDILWCVRGSTVGRRNFADKEYAIGRGLASIRSKYGINHTKLVSLILDQKLSSILQSSSGSTFPNVSRTQLENLEIFLPSIEEQMTIADIFSSILQQESLNLKINKTLEEMAQTLYKHWFIQEDTEEEIELSQIVELNPRLTIKKEQISSFIDMKALPINASSIQYTSIQKKAFSSGSKFQNEDVLLARITPCFQNGKAALVNCLEENEIAFGSTEFLVLRSNKHSCSMFLYCLCKDLSFLKYAEGSMVGSSGRQRIQNDFLLKYKLPKFTQEKMTNFKLQTTTWFKVIANNTLQNYKLAETRNYLLPLLLSRDIEVKEAKQIIKEVLTND